MEVIENWRFGNGCRGTEFVLRENSVWDNVEHDSRSFNEITCDVLSLPNQLETLITEFFHLFNVVSLSLQIDV